MFSQACVSGILSTGGWGACMAGRGVVGWGDMHGRGVCGRGHA